MPFQWLYALMTSHFVEKLFKSEKNSQLTKLSANIQNRLK